MASEDLKSKNVVAGNSSAEGDEENESGDDLGIISFGKLNLGPKKKLIVLSLGGLVVHRANLRREREVLKRRRPDFSHGNFIIYKRPFCAEFLKFCFERFEVALWSSALERNIEPVLKTVMGELRNKLLFTWDQEECSDTGFMCLENKDKQLFLKELRHVWDKKYSSLPWRVGEYSPSNTLLIDTNPYKALLNPPGTGIFPQAYDPNDRDDTFLGPEGEFRGFLDGVAETKDVRSYVKDHPFGQPSITPSHPDWDYYKKVIASLGKEKISHVSGTRMA